MSTLVDDLKRHFYHGNMVIKLVFVNLAVFVFFGLFYLLAFLFQSFDLYDAILTKLETPASFSRLLYQPWAPFTYMFLHTAFLHMIFNMLWLYWFGEIFVLYLGDKKVLPLYLLGGLAGAVVYLLAFNLIPVFKPQVEGSLMLGASASIFAIVFAAATINPEHSVRLMFVGDVRIKYIALVAIILDVINIPNGNAGGYIAHIGGALIGFLYIKVLRSGFDFASPFNYVFDRAAAIVQSKPGTRVVYKNITRKTAERQTRDKDDQEKVDEILDKIARSGYDSLTKQEKEFLFNFSKK